MQLVLTCTTCGEVVRILTEDPGVIPRCPCCGRRFAVIASSDGEPAIESPRIDDNIVSWLSETPASSERNSAGDATCQSCGYAGMIGGDSVCPVCLEVNPTRLPARPPTVDCPNCGQAIALSDADRGKTTICPGCKYFLGCVVPPPKRLHRKLGGGR
jgi:ssDNA-binding Zn-finger/Zn-ribbon topoisomerase 1